jgi:predicted HTH domain antitoxin
MDIKKRILENLTETQKYTLLLLSANNFEPIRGKLWFQKELFLLAKNSDELAEQADFEADFMGPYSESADEELEQLEFAKVVEKEGNKLKLTGLGREIAEILEKNTSDEEKEMIEDFKSELNDLTEDELLGFIYFTYPEMTRESVKFEKIKPKRKSIALSLYAKSKISLGKALEIAGMNIDTFMKEAKLKGIQIYT